MFSIIMSVWKQARRVSETIDSVLAQSCGDYELLVIDNTANESARQIVAPYLGPKVRYFPIPDLLF